MALTAEEKEQRAKAREAKAREREARQQEKERLETERLEAMRVYEREYEATCDYICGIDEAGRGPLAGPVVAAAVILPAGLTIPLVNDSKKLTERRRELLYPEIMEKAVAVGVGIVCEKRIDQINILQATYEAMRQAIENLAVRPDVLLNDAVRIPGVEIPQVPIVKGDAKSISIACASIIAKVTRDRMMSEYEKQYPGYGFASHKGYGSASHMEAIRSLGPCPLHRRTFLKNIRRQEETE
ncbi:MAG: ribonuclease HII [Lachnospiraceae bacterium]|jgi:ribonuclease HII|nr:ribonuclease HII [Lachnospiraceae bacterium]